MSDLDKSIRDLRDRTNRNRRQFLEIDTKSCLIAIEKAHLEISLGNTHEARKELRFASRGAEIIERFLREATGDMGDAESKLRDLKSSLEGLRAALGPG